jgi:hypothetical protein
LQFLICGLSHFRVYAFSRLRISQFPIVEAHFSFPARTITPATGLLSSALFFTALSQPSRVFSLQFSAFLGMPAFLRGGGPIAIRSRCVAVHAKRPMLACRKKQQ